MSILNGHFPASLSQTFVKRNTDIVNFWILIKWAGIIKELVSNDMDGKYVLNVNERKQVISYLQTRSVGETVFELSLLKQLILKKKHGDVMNSKEMVWKIKKFQIKYSIKYFPTKTVFLSHLQRLDLSNGRLAANSLQRKSRQIAIREDTQVKGIQNILSFTACKKVNKQKHQSKFNQIRFT